MANKIKLLKLNRAIENAKTYNEYREACIAHDEVSGADKWKENDVSRDYDYRMIRKRNQRMKLALSRGDAAGLISILHEGIHGNLGNISNPTIAKHAKFGTKKLIEEFIDLVCDALDMIYQADESDIDFYEKLSFFDETAHAFGQSCMMLSGGAGLGFFHGGVIKALHEQDLIPQVISGSSAGSIIASIVGTSTNEELDHLLSPEAIHEKFCNWRSVKGVSRQGLLNSTNLENTLIELFDVMTFDEAYQKTERKLTVTVSPADLHQYSRLLNAKTSPNAIITQAVRASCAIPFVFSPVQLKAKDQAGNIVPYIPSRRFADGSIMADLPFQRLARLYGVNHSIVSQTNPIAVPFLEPNKKNNDGLGAMTLRHLTKLAKINSVYAFDMLEKITSNRTARLGIHKIRSIVDQQYVGDINIIPERGLGKYRHVMANPSIGSVAELLQMGEKATWPQLNTIKRNTQIGKAFRKYLTLLEQRQAKLLSNHKNLRLVG